MGYDWVLSLVVLGTPSASRFRSGVSVRFPSPIYGTVPESFHMIRSFCDSNGVSPEVVRGSIES